MSTKKVIASFVVELTESENGSLLTTVTPLGRYEDSYVQRAIEMLSDTFVTHRKLWRELLTTSDDHLRYRC